MHTLADLHTVEWTTHYISYLNYREKGLRKQAFDELELFFIDFKKRSSAERRWFIIALYELDYQDNTYSFYLPQNLCLELITPEINVWIEEEPDNPIAYKWSADIKHLNKSVVLNPHDQVSLNKFLSRVTGHVDMNQHEVEFGYPYYGDPAEDLAALENAEQYLHFMENNLSREELEKKIEELKAVARTALL